MRCLPIERDADYASVGRGLLEDCINFPTLAYERADAATSLSRDIAQLRTPIRKNGDSIWIGRIFRLQHQRHWITGLAQCDLESAITLRLVSVGILDPDHRKGHGRQSLAR